MTIDTRPLDQLGPHGRRLRAANLRRPIIAAEAELIALGTMDGRPCLAKPIVDPPPHLVREWARQHGIVVGATGRIRRDLYDDYADAHPDQATA